MLAFLHLIAATVLTTDLGYAALFVAFVVATPWMLALTHLRVEIEGRKKRSFEHVPVLGSLPLDAFPAAKFVRDPLVLITHTRDPLGAYEVWLSLVDATGKRRQPVTGQGLPVRANRVRVARYRLTR